MLLANVSQRCYFSAEMSHRRGALGAVHHHRRSPRHVRPAVRGSSASGARYQPPTEGPGFGVSSAATDLPGRKRREGKRIAIEEERESRPDVKAAGCRGEDEECDVRLRSRDTAPPSDQDVMEGQKLKSHGFFSLLTKIIISILSVSGTNIPPE
ncbi:hypothetical protein ABVT39_011950 [Epinephelus coioides]